MEQSAKRILLVDDDKDLLHLISMRLGASGYAVATAESGEAALAAMAVSPLDEARRAFERDYLARILKITAGNVTRAARLAGRNRTEFYRLLRRHALEPGMFKPSPREPVRS